MTVTANGTSTDVQAWRSRDVSRRSRRQADTDVHRRRVHRLRAGRRSAGSRREGQARDLDAEPRAGACGAGAEADAVVPRTRSTRTARQPRSALLRRRTPTEAERALTQAREALQKATEAVQQAQAQLQGRGARRGARGRGALTAPDFTTAQRVDAPAIPQIVGDETFFEALFAGSAGWIRRAQGEGREGRAARRGVAARDDHDRHRQHVRNCVRTADAERRRHDRGHGPNAQEHLRDVRRAPRSRRLQPGRCRSAADHDELPVAKRGAQAAVKAAGKVVQNPGRGRGAPAAAAAPGGSAGHAEPPRRRRFPSSSATSSATAPTMTGRDRRRCWRSRRHLRPDRSRSDRSSSSGTPERRRGLQGSRLQRRLLRRSARQGAGRAQHGHGGPRRLQQPRRATTRTRCSSSARTGSAPTCTT